MTSETPSLPLGHAWELLLETLLLGRVDNMIHFFVTFGHLPLDTLLSEMSGYSADWLTKLFALSCDENIVKL